MNLNIYIRNKHNRHLFSGFTKINNHKHLYQRKKSELSSYYLKNKLSNNTSIKSIKKGIKGKNYSSNNILGTNNNLSRSKNHSSIKNKNKIINKINGNTKIINIKNESKKKR